MDEILFQLPSNPARRRPRQARPTQRSQSCRAEPQFALRDLGAAAPRPTAAQGSTSPRVPWIARANFIGGTSLISAEPLRLGRWGHGAASRRDGGRCGAPSGKVASVVGQRPIHRGSLTRSSSDDGATGGVVTGSWPLVSARCWPLVSEWFFVVGFGWLLAVGFDWFSPLVSAEWLGRWLHSVLAVGFGWLVAVDVTAFGSVLDPSRRWFRLVAHCCVGW